MDDLSRVPSNISPTYWNACGFEGRFLFFQAAVSAFFAIRSSGRLEKLGMRG
jgi:hypothetical protein